MASTSALHNRLLLLLLLWTALFGTVTTNNAAPSNTSDTSSVNARAWRASPDGALLYPELRLGGILAKKNVGVCFTGGGTRAMVAAFGQMRALHDLGLMNQARYISGISGGNWATHIFSWYQPGAPGVAANDAQLLGPIIAPENITSLASLQVMDPKCARSAACRLPLPWAESRLRELLAKHSLAKRNRNASPSSQHRQRQPPAAAPSATASAPSSSPSSSPTSSSSSPRTSRRLDNIVDEALADLSWIVLGEALSWYERHVHPGDDLDDPELGGPELDHNNLYVFSGRLAHIPTEPFPPRLLS